MILQRKARAAVRVHSYRPKPHRSYYSSFILQKLRPSSAPVASALAKQTGVAIAKLAGVSTAFIVVNRVGRRPVLLVGSSVMLLSHVAFGLLCVN